MGITGKTKITGIFGHPVEQSLSPAMHNAAFARLKLDYCYLAFDVLPELLKEAVNSVRALNMRGINVTVPHKENVLQFLDKIDEEAAFIGAANTILNSDGLLTGYNTDGRGFMESLSEAGISAEKKNIIVLGAGGAARAISYYLGKEASRLFIFDTDTAKAAGLANALSNILSNVRHTDELKTLRGIDMLINATPLGLNKADSLPVNASFITSEMVVCDLIYRDTPLLQAAAGKGCKTMNGLGMLLHQGILAFEIWTGIKPPVDVMRSAISLY